MLYTVRVDPQIGAKGAAATAAPCNGKRSLAAECLANLIRQSFIAALSQRQAVLEEPIYIREVAVVDRKSVV